MSERNALRRVVVALVHQMVGPLCGVVAGSAKLVQAVIVPSASAKCRGRVFGVRVDKAALRVMKTIEAEVGVHVRPPRLPILRKLLGKRLRFFYRLRRHNFVEEIQPGAKQSRFHLCRIYLHPSSREWPPINAASM